MKRFKQNRVCFWRSVSHLAVACILSVMMPPVSASANETERVFSAERGAVVNRTLELANNQDYQAALKLLESQAEAPDLSAFERGTIYQMIGQYSYELDQLDIAQAAFETALSSGGLLPHEEKNIQIVIAQLMIASGNYREGGERLKALVKADDSLKLQHIELIVQAGAQAEDYHQVLPWAELWFESVEVKERRHYDMLYFLYAQLNMRDRQLEFLTEMIEKWPEDKTLLRAFMGQLVIANRDEDAFEVAKLLYRSSEITTERELIELVHHYRNNDLPFQAAEILEREMEAKRIKKTPERLKMLGELFVQARERERAHSIFESIVETSDDVEFLSSLGQISAEIGACRKAESVLQKAISRGYSLGKGQMLIGNCYYDQAANSLPLSCEMTFSQRESAPKTMSLNAALNAFKKVPKGSRDKANAQKWVKFIAAETSAEEKRCHFISPPIGTCFHEIKRAYDAAIFIGEFKLDDDNCPKYKPEYDAKFRKTQVGLGK